MTKQNHEHYEILMMKAIDGRLSSLEKTELDEHLQTCEECREELSDFQVIKDNTEQIRQRILADAEIEPFRENAPTKAISYLAFTLLFTGALVLMGFAAYTFFLDEKVPLLVKAGAGIAGGGGLILFAYVLRVRLRGIKHDPYKEIDL